MVQAPAGNTANIHTRALAYRFKPFKNLNLARAVLTFYFCCFF